MCRPLSFFKISHCRSQHREEGMELETECDETKPPYRHIARPPASGQDLINLLEITPACVCGWVGVGACMRVCVCVFQGHEDSSGMFWLKHRYDFTFAADRLSISSGLWSVCKRKTQ